jgi:hypothetical protein
VRKLAPFLIVPALLVVGACDEDEVKKTVQDVQDTIEGAIDEAGARGAAEVFRGALRRADVSDEEGGVRQITVLEENAEDVPGDPEFVGIEDTDNDGLDDDGLVEVRVGDRAACVMLPTSGEDIDVTNDACSL